MQIRKLQENINATCLRKNIYLEIATRKFNNIFMLSKRNLETHFGIMLWLLTFTVRILRYENFDAIYLKSNIYNFLILLHFACDIPQFKMLMMSFLSDVWI